MPLHFKGLMGFYILTRCDGLLLFGLLVHYITLQTGFVVCHVLHSLLAMMTAVK